MGNLIVAWAKKQNSQLCEDQVDTTGELWHKRLCHMSQKRMQMLAGKDVLLKMKNVHLDKCADCLDDKQNRDAFHPRPPMWRKTVVELVHTDVSYVDKISHSGGYYFITFIDYYNRKLWAYVLKMKDLVLSIFKEFQARIERESGKKLKVVRTNNKGQYIG